MGNLIAVAFDPGITTGYAVGVLEDGSMAVRPDQAQYELMDLWAYLHFTRPDWLIWEKFVFRKRTGEGVELFSREIIGVLRLYAQIANEKRKDVVRTHEQMPMKSAGSYYSDTKISDDGLWIPGKPHAMDALRHLLYWFTFGPGYQYNTKGYHSA